MSDIPDFTDAERQLVEARRMIERYGQLVALQDADAELQLDPGSEALTTVPDVYWNERNVQFVVCKLGEQRFRCQFFYTEDAAVRHRPRTCYDDLERLRASTLLQVQVRPRTRSAQRPSSVAAMNAA